MAGDIKKARFHSRIVERTSRYIRIGGTRQHMPERAWFTQITSPSDGSHSLNRFEVIE